MSESMEVTVTSIILIFEWRQLDYFKARPGWLPSLSFSLFKCTHRRNIHTNP